MPQHEGQDRRRPGPAAGVCGGPTIRARFEGVGARGHGGGGAPPKCNTCDARRTRQGCVVGGGGGGAKPDFSARHVIWAQPQRGWSPFSDHNPPTPFSCPNAPPPPQDLPVRCRPTALPKHSHRHGGGRLLAFVRDSRPVGLGRRPPRGGGGVWGGGRGGKASRRGGLPCGTG